MMWTEAEIIDALEGHFWVMRHEPHCYVVDALASVEESMPRGPYKEWTDEDRLTLWKMRHEGCDFYDIADELGRDPVAIESMWKRRAKWRHRVRVPQSVPTKEKRELTLAGIKEAVCDVYSITEIDLRSNRRYRLTAEARHVFCFLARALTLHSTPQIGRAVARDHTTAIYGAEKVKQDFDYYRNAVETVLFDLGADLPESAL